MTKREFEKFINQNLRNLSIEHQEELLIKIKDKWIPEVLERKLKNYTKCVKCGKYSFTRKFKTITVLETRIETTYVDAGYGDDDKYGEVEYLVEYSVCPICGYRKEKKKCYMRTIWEKGRS
ncbi:MAG: hypothetical protein Q4D02_00085 [Clostridia bacterium]|nr:hypothetical protein [Clostridia bacterium]